MSLKLVVATLLISLVFNQCTTCGSLDSNCANCNSFDVGNSLLSSSYGASNTLSSLGLGGLNTGLNSGYSGISGLNGFNGLSGLTGYTNAGLTGLNQLTGLNTDFTSLSTNVGSLGLVGTGVGLNTTGLGGYNNPLGGDASFVLNTPSLTGNTFTSSIVNSVVPSNTVTVTSTPITTTPIATSVTTIIPSSTIGAYPTALGLKVKDSNGAIIQVNAYDAFKTTGVLSSRSNLDKFNMFNSKNYNGDDLVRDTIVSGEALLEGEYLRSKNKAYYLVLQSDGNLVIYRSRVLIAKNSFWASNTELKGTPGNRRLTLNNGFASLSSGGSEFWRSGGGGGNAPWKLTMQDDGNLVLSDTNRKILWTSDTVKDNY